MERLQRLSYISIIFIGLVALFAVTKTMSTITAPIMLALVAGIVLSPFSALLERFGFSPASGALVSLVATLGLIAILVLVFQPLVMQLIEQAPKVWSDLQGVVDAAKSMIQGAREAAEEISAVVDQTTETGVTASDVSGNISDAMPMSTVTTALLLAPTIAAQILTFAGTLFFFLMTRAQIYGWAARQFAEPMQRGEIAKRLFDAERSVSRYFLTISVINGALGVSVGIGLTLIDMPGAVLWGFLAFLMNFVVYLGPAAMVAGLIFAGIGSFDGGMSLVPVAIYAGLNTMEGQFITPSLVGRSLSMNPLLIFLSLIFGIWIWGPIGGVVAMPILLWVLALNDALRHPERTAGAPTTATGNTATD